MREELKRELRALLPGPVLGGIRAVRRRMQEAGRRRAQTVPTGVRRVNLGCGQQHIAGYLGVDVQDQADFRLDLETENLPFPDGSLDVVVCTSAINYLSPARAQALIVDVHRALVPGGVARFSSQDLDLLARHYVEHHDAFFDQRLPDGTPRFPGPTRADKLASWFYGFPTAGGPCRYVYDFDSLAWRFHQAGFSIVERRAYQDSRIPEVKQIDNRPDQMFFLEAVKGPA